MQAVARFAAMRPAALVSNILLLRRARNRTVLSVAMAVRLGVMRTDEHVDATAGFTCRQIYGVCPSGTPEA